MQVCLIELSLSRDRRCAHGLLNITSALSITQNCWPRIWIAPCLLPRISWTVFAKRILTSSQILSLQNRHYLFFLFFLYAFRLTKVWKLISKELGMFPISMFQPRVDSERQDPFLPDEPKKLLEQKRYQPVPLITGVTQNEGALFVACNMQRKFG